MRRQRTGGRRCHPRRGVRGRLRRGTRGSRRLGCFPGRSAGRSGVRGRRGRSTAGGRYRLSRRNSRRWRGRTGRRGSRGYRTGAARQRRPNRHARGRTGLLRLGRFSGCFLRDGRFSCGARLLGRTFRRRRNGLFGNRRVFLPQRVVVFDFEFFDRGSRPIASGRIAAAEKVQAQLLRYILVDRAGVGFFLRDAQLR